MKVAKALLIAALLIGWTQVSWSEALRVYPASRHVQEALAKVESQVLIDEKYPIPGGGNRQRSIELTHLKRIPNIRGKHYVAWLRSHKDHCLAEKKKLLTAGLGIKHPEIVLLDDRIRIARYLLQNADEGGTMNLIPEDDDYAKELLAPRWELVEKHFKTEVPQMLKDYYANPDKILRHSFELKTPLEVGGVRRIYVDTFDRINEGSTEHFEGFEKYLEIASDGGEGTYFIDPKEEDPKVSLYLMDPGQLMETGLRLSEFLSKKRLPPSEE